ncbi:MAG TPA: hypothetical protein VGN10_13215 [Pyrinomonadaceae bacterium]|jgi:type II secretory pathway component PulK
MKRDSKLTATNRAGERGAALVTMLLVSVLLLGAGGALIMTTMMSANNSVGSTAEMQAYYVAESGMQSALNVLRGNTKPLLVDSDRMSFRTAIIPRAFRTAAMAAHRVFPVGCLTTIRQTLRVSCP